MIYVTVCHYRDRELVTLCSWDKMILTVKKTLVPNQLGLTDQKGKWWTGNAVTQKENRKKADNSRKHLSKGTNVLLPGLQGNRVGHK